MNAIDLLEQSLGFLVGKMGISEGLAATIVGVLASAGPAAVAAAWPFLAPFVVTLRGILTVVGTTAAIGW
ncbi:hypothetical protein ACQGS6_26795 [Bacillus sp. GMs2/2]|uniref:hypothetical protein n=1 Tax=Bacillus sp. GMs2/2 TaxID=3418494 RepID=UPI003CEFEF03